MLVSTLPSTGAAAPGWADPGARDAVMDVLWSIAHTDKAHREALEVISVEHLGRTTDPCSLSW